MLSTSSWARNKLTKGLPTPDRYSFKYNKVDTYLYKLLHGPTFPTHLNLQLLNFYFNDSLGETDVVEALLGKQLTNVPTTSPTHLFYSQHQKKLE